MSTDYFTFLPRTIKSSQKSKSDPKLIFQTDSYRLWGILKDHRGWVHLTVEGYVAFVRRYLSWQFGDREARWADVRAQDIWLYAELCTKGHTSGYAKTRLGALRRFLGFVHLRGA